MFLLHFKTKTTTLSDELCTLVPFSYELDSPCLFLGWCLHLEHVVGSLRWSIVPLDLVHDRFCLLWHHTNLQWVSRWRAWTIASTCCRWLLTFRCRIVSICAASILIPSGDYFVWYFDCGLIICLFSDWLPPL